MVMNNSRIFRGSAIFRLLSLALLVLLLAAGCGNGGKRGFVDTNNHVVLPIEFDDGDPIENDQLFWVKKDGRYGLYDRCGNCTLE